MPGFDISETELFKALTFRKAAKRLEILET
jgi:hypothetical protein